MDYHFFDNGEHTLQVINPNYTSKIPWIEPGKRLRVLIWGKDGVYHQFHTILATNMRNWGYEVVFLPPLVQNDFRAWQEVEGDILLYDMDVSLTKTEQRDERGHPPLSGLDQVSAKPVLPRVRLLVALSSYSVSRRSLEELGAVTLLRKPFDMGHLERYLRVFQRLFYTDAASVCCSARPGPAWYKYLETTDKEERALASSSLQQKPAVRILVADDSREITRSLHQSLVERKNQLYRYEVREAHDGLELLEQCLVWRPQCVVTDLLMPWLNGYQVMQCLTAGQFQSAPAFVVISALLQHEIPVTRSYLQDKVVLYVAKPFDIGNLLVLIEQALAQ